MINFTQFKQANHHLNQIHQLNQTVQSNQTNVKVAKNLSKVKLSIQLRKFFRYHTESMLTAFEFGKVFGHTLLYFLLINSPINAYLVMTLLNKSLPTIQTIILVNLALYQFGLIFGMHLLAMNYPRSIHQSGKCLSSLNTMMDKCISNLPTRLKLFHYTFKIHTINQYKLSYGSIGQVSLATFFKVCLFKFSNKDHSQFINENLNTRAIQFAKLIFRFLIRRFYLKATKKISVQQLNE